MKSPFVVEVEVLERAAKAATAAGSADGHKVTEIFEAYRRGDISDLPAALGLKTAVGQRDPRSRLSLAKRNEIIRVACQRFYKDATPHAAAKEFHDRLEHYRGGDRDPDSDRARTGWERDRTHSELPAWRIGKIEAYFWDLLREIDHVPAERTIRRVLAIKGDSWPSNQERISANRGENGC